MLKAGAFIYALFIMFIVSMLTLLFLTQTRLYSTEISRMQIRERLEENCISAVNYALATEGDLFKEQLEFDLFGKGADKVLVKKSKWGLMDIVSVTALGQNQQKEKTALLGYMPPDSLKTSLYLSGSQAALHLCGETRIKGDVYLPEAGAKRAYIAGQSYFGDSLIFGKQNIAEQELPLEKDTIGIPQLRTLFSYSIEQQEVLEQSFRDSTRVISEVDPIFLEDINLKGNILIRSDSLVEIYPSAVLEDVIVMAPIIRVKQDARFSAQLIASDSIIIEKNAVLDYPSVVDVESKDSGHITLSTGAKLYGDLWYRSAKLPSNISVEVNIEKDALVAGRLMVSNGNLQHAGEVNGEVYTQGFILHHPVGIYKNHLLASKIDRRALWKAYLFSLKVREEDKANVIKWLN